MIVSVHTHEEWAEWGRQMRDENERLRDALEHAAEYLSIIDTAKGRSAIGGIIREALNA